jgi:hypothetical protein
MTVLAVAQRAALVLGLDQPDVLMSSTDREYQELARLCNDTARMICEDFDWQILQKLNTFTGDGVSETFPLPTDYDRMAETSSMWSSKWTWSFNHIVSTDHWLEYLVVPYTFISGNWIIYGGQYHFLPIMKVAETIKFFYISTLIVTGAGGAGQTAFVADTDSFKINERLLELGIIWRSKKDKGLPFDAAKAEYDDLLLKEMKRDGGSRGVVNGNTTRYGRGVKLAFPQTVGG